MKIVINALQYKKNNSGIGILLRNLFGPYTEIAQRQHHVVLPHDSPDFPVSSFTEIIRVPWVHRQHLWRIFFQTFQLGRKYCKDAILLTTDSKVPFFLPKSCILVPLITDLAVYRMRETYQFSRVLWWRLQYRYVCRRARMFLAISEFTKQEMVKILHVPPEKIEVVPCAASLEMRPAADEMRLSTLRVKYHLPEYFILFVGNFNPRKNLERLIRAFDRAKENGIPHRLVIAGEQGWKFSRDAALQGIQHTEDVRFIGYVPDEDMPALYSAADLFVFPSLYEGFGIPVIEAQACGTPVLASSGSALPEVGGDGAVYVDPYDIEDISNGILQVLQNPALMEQLRQNGLSNARRFSWRTSAEHLDRVIEKAVSE